MSKFLIFLILPMHFFLLYSIFDIYFTSPITPDLSHVYPIHSALAKRLVLIVADGLRANKLFYKSMENMPYLKKMINEGSSWGLSYTRVPTETRPGHVALIAGFYEDISSITKGWKENAVEFDSIFNQSSKTWSWGSPDVLPMFQKGAVKEKVNIFCYDQTLEDFAGNRTWELDTWVFDHVKTFINDVQPKSKLDQELRQEGVVLFLHLLGIDVSGHSQKPHSDQYAKNMRIASEGIENMTTIINNFYGDNATAFIVTSDHGMTDWGSHGDGSNDETITPIIAWGSGIYRFYNLDRIDKVIKSSIKQFQNFEVESAMINGLHNDISQADLTPLMASLLGIPIPINSVGVVPIEYLSANESVKASIMRTNILQLFIQYETKFETKRSSSIFYFQEYSDLPMKMAYEELERIPKLSSNGRYQEAIQLYQHLAQLLLDGITYYHKYDRLWLGFLISSTFILWIMYLATFIVHTPDIRVECPYKLRHFIILAVIAMIFIIYGFLEHQPYSYLFYQIIPASMVWYLVIFRWIHIQTLFHLTKENLLFLFGLILLAESLVWSFFSRHVLSLGLFLTFLIILSDTYRSISIKLRLQWAVCCAALMIYPNLPVIGGQNNYFLVFIGALSNIFLAFHILKFTGRLNKIGLRRAFLKVMMMVLIVFTALHVLYCQVRVKSGLGLSTNSQIINWFTFLFIIPIICCSSMNISERLDLLQVAIAVIYNLMSIYYELFFLLCLNLFTITWRDIELQYRQQHSSAQLIDRRKIVQTVIYVFLLTYSFFATGNIASVSSFDVASTYCFVTMFRPFLMCIILLVKIMLPMLVISLSYINVQYNQDKNVYASPYASMITKESQLNIKEICLVTIVSDFAALHFLFMIRDEGSWLQIGTSISNYVITMGISITAFLFTVLSKYLLSMNVLIPQLRSGKSK